MPGLQSVPVRLPSGRICGTYKDATNPESPEEITLHKETAFPELQQQIGEADSAVQCLQRDARRSAQQEADGQGSDGAAAQKPGNGKNHNDMG